MRVLALFSIVLALVAFTWPDGAVRPAADDKATYDAQCAMCHGEAGKGDGMAAAALNPSPPDFTTAEFQSGRTDDELRAAIESGKGAMPGYAGKLDADQLTSMVAYIRSLAASD